VATKTYLQLVNKTLLLLREPQVAAVAADYSLLIGEYVNQAKEKVEKAWRWRALVTELTFTTLNAQQNYLLQSTATPPVTSSTGRFPDERAFLARDDDYTAQVFDITVTGQNYRLKEFDLEDYTYINYVGGANTVNQQPAAFASTGGQTPAIALLALPPAGRIIKSRWYIPQDEFSVGSEILLVPWRPVVSLAYALANEERGEELGVDGQLLFSKAADDLALAIANETESDIMEMRPD